MLKWVQRYEKNVIRSLAIRGVHFKLSYPVIVNEVKQSRAGHADDADEAFRLRSM